MKERYINTFTDFGFKRLFGTEPNKDLLIDFLNELLRQDEIQIRDLNFMDKEHLGAGIADRSAIFDLYCETESGEKIIVELQKARQDFFKDRSIFYSTFPIQEQAEKGDWSFELKAVYTVGILGFCFLEHKNDKDYFHHEVKLMDVNRNTIFYDKLSYVYLELPKFNKTEEQLESHFDKWLYVLKNLHTFKDRPSKLEERIFRKLFDVAEIAAFSPEERDAYEHSLKYYRDLHNVVDSAERKGEKIGEARGRQKGREEGKLEVARNLLDMLDDETIAVKTGLSVEEIRKLRG
jgi:predicted transposase/invertase (TIGR01784 family)